MRLNNFCAATIAALLINIWLIQNLTAATLNDGIMAFNEGRSKEAEAFFMSTLKEAEFANESLIYLSKINLQKGDAQAAAKHIDQALLLAPNNAEELLTAGNVYCGLAQQASILSALKIAKKCIAYYESAIQIEPENAPALLAAIKFHMEAPSIAGGSSKRGRELLDRLEKTAPEDASTYKIYLLDKENKKADAQALADTLSQQGFKSAENQYAVAHYYKENKLFAQSKALFTPLLTWPETPQNKWHIQDSYLQLGEILLTEATDQTQGIKLIETYKMKNNNPDDIHYFWSTWSLAKGYKAIGQLTKYNDLVNSIKTMDYKKNTAFAKEFDSATAH